MLRQMYRTIRDAVPAVERLREWAAPRGGTPLADSPGDGRGIAFGGVALRVFGDPGDAYYAAAATHMRSQDRVCSVLRACCAAREGGAAAATAVDIGANIGLATLAMATALPNTARLLAVEPSPRNLVHLRRNLAENGMAERVEVVAAAAGAEPGSLRFHESEYGAGSHLVSDQHLADGTMPTV